MEKPKMVFMKSMEKSMQLAYLLLKIYMKTLRIVKFNKETVKKEVFSRWSVINKLKFQLMNFNRIPLFLAFNLLQK